MNVLLLHGFLGAPSTFDGMSPAATSVRPWLPGHGPEPQTGAKTFEEVVDAIAKSLTGPVVVAGYSMGARLGLALALQHPALVRAAVLAGANPGHEDEHSRAERRDWDDAQSAAILERGLPAFVDGWERLPLFSTQARLPEALRAANRARRLAHTPEGAAYAMRTMGLGRQPSLWNALATSKVPMTFLAGGYDGKFAELAFRASQMAPRGALQIVPGAGHNLALEAPDAFAAAIAAQITLLPHEETTA
jgi:2-succinyl-6-hydroxy-2,4-cyclohexadiene-1-carboxylate synthase